MEQEHQTKQCPYCGEEISNKALKCKHCGEWLSEKPAKISKFVDESIPQAEMQPQVIVNQIERRSNGIGTAGFVLALICALFSWLPGVNLILWSLGLLFSFIGLFKRPRGLAVAGFLISIIDIIIIVSILGAIGSFLSGIIK